MRWAANVTYGTANYPQQTGAVAYQVYNNKQLPTLLPAAGGEMCRRYWAQELLNTTVYVNYGLEIKLTWESISTPQVDGLLACQLLVHGVHSRTS